MAGPADNPREPGEPGGPGGPGEHPPSKPSLSRGSGPSTGDAPKWRSSPQPQPKPHQPRPQPQPDRPAPGGTEPGIHEIYELAEPAENKPPRDPAATAHSATVTAATVPPVSGASSHSSERHKKKKSTLTSPPRQRGLLTGWVVMLICLAGAAVPMLVVLHRPAVFHPAEAESLVTSLETWQRQAALTYDNWSLESLEALIPVYKGRIRLDATPGTTWMHLLAFQMLPAGPDDATTEQIILAGRAVSVVCGLLTVAAVFWIGFSIGSLRTAVLAAMVCIANPLLLYYSRLAGPEMPQVALATLTIAAAVWAIRPLKMAGSRVRQAVGWLLCGVCLGLVTLTGGAGILPFVLVPLIFIFALYPNRLGHLMGLVAAVIVAALLTTPWALYTHEQDAATWQAWIHSLVPDYFHDPALLREVVSERAALLVLATLPWTAWLVAGLLQPFSTSSAGARLRMFLGWVWFAPVALLLLGAPGEGAPREMLIVLPAAALLVGQVIRQYSDLSDEGRHARIWRLLRWPHAFVLMFASAAIPLVGAYQVGMQRAGWLAGPVSADMPMGYWIGLGFVLLGIVLLSMRFAERHHPGRTIACWAMWVVVAVATVALTVAHGPLMATPFERAGREVGQAAVGVPVYWLAPSEAAAGDGVGDGEVDPRLRLYSRRRLRTVNPSQLANLHDGHERFYLVGDAEAALDDTLHRVSRFDAAGLALWEVENTSAASDERDTAPDANE